MRERNASNGRNDVQDFSQAEWPSCYWTNSSVTYFKLAVLWVKDQMTSGLFTLQQDGAPAHGARETVQLLSE